MDSRAILDALPGPAALLDVQGAVRAANGGFDALPPADRAAAAAAPPGEGEVWRVAPAGTGLRLVTAADPRLAQRARVLATLSHEVRTPLNGVLGMAGLLSRTRLDADQAAYLRTLRDSGDHLLALVEEVLDYARLDADRVELQPVPTDVEHLLQTVCELLSPRAHAEGLEIAWAVEGAPPPRILADDGRLRQILFNLAGNAVKLTARGGVLLTAAAAPAGPARVRLRLGVRDTGPGLTQEAQARVWREFEQAEDGARAGGAGLGLAIVRRLAEAFDGRLGVQSLPGEGALFWFEADFPVADAGPSARRPLQGVRVGVRSSQKVVTAAAALQIAAAGGSAFAENYGEAVSAPVDVRLIDCGDEGPAGPPDDGVPALVLLTAEARDGIEAARTLGYAGYLIKPLRAASLVDRVRAALGRSHRARSRTGRVEDERGASAAAATGLRVLLAEDNAINALLARSLLQREGCTVERAATGEEAVEAARRSPFDLVLMDLRMPGLDGLAATRALRAAGVTTPVVALTANAFAEDRRACLDAGMSDFLTKPLDPAVLRAVLARAAPRRAAA